MAEGRNGIEFEVVTPLKISLSPLFPRFYDRFARQNQCGLTWLKKEYHGRRRTVMAEETGIAEDTEWTKV